MDEMATETQHTMCCNSPFGGKIKIWQAHADTLRSHTSSALPLADRCAPSRRLYATVML